MAVTCSCLGVSNETKQWKTTAPNILSKSLAPLRMPRDAVVLKRSPLEMGSRNTETNHHARGLRQFSGGVASHPFGGRVMHGGRKYA